MAVEALVSPIVDLLLGKLGSLAYQQVSLISGVKNDLEKLQRTLTTIKVVLLDAKEQLHNRQVGVWLEALKDVCYDAEDVFDEFQVEALRRQVLAERGSIPKKVCNALSWQSLASIRYLKELLSRSFFQDFEEYVGEHIFTFKLHDLMHDLALSMVKNECAIVVSPNHSISKKTLHLSFVEDDMIKDVVPSFLSNTCRLRTICFPNATPTQSFVESYISMFPFLRYLDLSGGSSIVLLPKKLGNLRHLRYLDLRGNGKIKKLPNSICKCQSLQTLILGGYEEL